MNLADKSTLQPTRRVSIFRTQLIGTASTDDLVAVEEPLSVFVSANNSDSYPLVTTMRTPGNDKELILGFLYSEGIINYPSDILNVAFSRTTQGRRAVINMTRQCYEIAISQQRSVISNSSCGVCAKSTIDELFPEFDSHSAGMQVASSIICSLASVVKTAQHSFEKTGGLHAAALLNKNAELICVYEDVGRHNAMDKLAGFTLSNSQLDISSHILFLSGRISYELVQKCARLGVGLIVAVGAPSSLAIDLAVHHKISLVGFVKEDKFNIYCDHYSRITKD